jgi:hypothetical protein
LCSFLFQLGPSQLTVALKLLLQFHRCPLPSPPIWNSTNKQKKL